MGQVPDKGISYGVLRFTGNDAQIKQQLAALPQAQMSFNYLGQLDQVISLPPLMGWSEEKTGHTQSPNGVLQHLLELNAYVIANQFTMQWTFGKQLYNSSTIKRLSALYLQELRTLLAAVEVN